MWQRQAVSLDSGRGSPSRCQGTITSLCRRRVQMGSIAVTSAAVPIWSIYAERVSMHLRDFDNAAQLAAASSDLRPAGAFRAQNAGGPVLRPDDGVCRELHARPGLRKKQVAEILTRMGLDEYAVEGEAIRRFAQLSNSSTGCWPRWRRAASASSALARCASRIRPRGNRGTETGRARSGRPQRHWFNSSACRLNRHGSDSFARRMLPFYWNAEHSRMRSTGAVWIVDA
jgi:hypothetical protein